MLPVSSQGGSASSASNSMVSSIVSPAPSAHRPLGQNVTTFFPYSLGRDRTLAPFGYNRLRSVRCDWAGYARSALPQFGSTPSGHWPVSAKRVISTGAGGFESLAPIRNAAERTYSALVASCV